MINAAANMIASIAGSQDRPGNGLVKATVARGPDQTGAFVLRLDGGRELSLQAAVGKDVPLTPGQNVLFSPADGKIFIPDPAQAQQQPVQANLSAVTGDAAQAAQAQQSAQTEQPLLSTQIQQSGQVPAGGPQEHLRDGFESPLLRSIPASVWEQVINERGGKADVETLKALDSALKNRSIPIDPSSPVQMERVGQWLRIVLDNPQLVEDLAERIPTSGAKDIAGLMELIGRVSAGVLPKEAMAGISPEQFFATADKIIGSGIPIDRLLALGIDKALIAALVGGLSEDKLSAMGIDKNLIAALGINTETGINANNRAALLEVLLKSTFSAAPTALLDLMKQINTSNAASLAQMPPAEAQRIVNSIVNTLPAQAPIRPEVLHDARQITPQNLNADIAAPQRSPVQTTVIPQIRAGYSGLTESAIQLLLGNDNKKAAAEVSNQINSLAKSVERIPVTDNRVDRGQSVPAGDRAAVVDRPAIDRASVAADKTSVANTPIDRGQPSIQASTLPTNEFRANIPVDNRQHTIPADRPPVINTPNNADRLTAINTPAAADRSTASTIPARADINTTRPIDIQSIRNDSLRIVDNLRTAAEPLLRSIERNSGIDTGEKTRLLGAVRDTISSLDNTLRPLAREGRPVPPEFYERVTSSPRHQISTDSKSDVFTRINTAQDLIRNVIDTAQAKLIPVDKGAANAVNTPPQQLSANKTTPNTINTSPPPLQLSANRSTPAPINTSPQPQQLSVDKPTSAAVNTSQQQQSPTDKTGPDNFLQMAQRMWANTEKIRAGFQEAFSSLDLPNRVSPLESSPDKSTPHVIKQSVDALRTEILLDVSRALREVFSSVDELRNIVAQLAEKLRMLPEMEKALLRAAQDLELQARQSGAEVNERLKDILKELTRLQADAMRARESGAEAALRSSPADFIRNAITGAARGLENLQLLANQTRGMDIQQQVLALPVKIGEEWNEVHIKFVKDKRGGDKKKDGHVSVYINVAPSKLGSVTAHLDFHPPASLKLSLQFEKPEATKWFREQAGELREVLSQAGLPGTALEFHTKRPTAVNTENKTASTLEKTEINKDIGIIGHDGKVDFKI